LAISDERYNRRLGWLWGVQLKECDDHLFYTIQHGWSVALAVRQLASNHQGVPAVPLFNFHRPALSMRYSVDGKTGEGGARLGTIGRDHRSQFSHKLGRWRARIGTRPG
jgi:hypothetical protein